MSKEQNDYKCLQLLTGNCRGCNILSMVSNSVRWKNIPLEEAANDIKRNYCPPNASPQTDLIQNTQASFGMGQSRSENLDFSSISANPFGEKLHRRY